MKQLSILAVLAAGLVVGSFVWAADHNHDHATAWFDVEHCDICRPLGSDQELMMHTKWETHDIKNGMMMIASTTPAMSGKLHDSFKKLHMNAEKVMSGGSEPHLCGFCQSYGKLLEAGAKEETVDTAFGNVTLLTAENPQTVKMIHEHAARSREETKKMEAAMAGH